MGRKGGGGMNDFEEALCNEWRGLEKKVFNSKDSLFLGNTEYPIVKIKTDDWIFIYVGIKSEQEEQKLLKVLNLLNSAYFSRIKNNKRHTSPIAKIGDIYNCNNRGIIEIQSKTNPFKIFEV